MEPRHLYTLRWTQPYSTEQLRPYLRALQLELEASIEALLDEMEYTEANAVIERIKQL
jgi:hypothetical protein